MSLVAWIFFAGLCLFEAVADIFAKEYASCGSLAFAVTSIALFVVANTSWLVALRYGCQLAVGTMIFGIAQGILGIVIGVGFYHETLEPVQQVGVGVGLVAIGLLCK